MSSLVDKAKEFMADKVSDIPKPDASLAGVSVQSLSRDGVLFHSQVSVSNPFPFPIPVCEIAYTLKSAGREIASGRLPNPESPAASAETMLELPVTVPYDILISLMRDLGRDWDIDYELDVGVTVDLPVVGNFTIPVSTAGEIKLPTLSDMVI
ncbi:desiccation protectant protein Lea14 homolog [Curcuma longa]|uniref:desiccation protectant protein Lea14 homolog n=1 Tax=Curcuma longa TaxID=136217 RepID=UPI003D9F87C1